MNNNNNNNNNNAPLSNRSDGIDSGSILSSIYSSNSVSSISTPNTNLTARSFSQNTPLSMTTDLDLSLITHTSALQNDQRRQIIQHLVLLLHAHKCLQRERQSNPNENNVHETTPHPSSCTVPHCSTMKSVLQHMTKCSDFKNCSFNHCVQSRHIILHWKSCTSTACFLCGPLKTPGAVRTPNPPNKDWQQQLHQDHRGHLVKKIVSSIVTTIQQDNHPISQERLTAITNYAQRTETDTFNTATSHEDYFQRLAERIYRIRKDYDEKQMLKKQNLTTSLASIDKSAGDQGPPNRIAPQSDFPSTYPTNAIKSEPISNHLPNLTTGAPFEKHRLSTEGLSRLAIHNNSTTATTNGTHVDTMMIKTEEIDTKVQTTTTTIVKKEEKITTETSLNGRNITTTTVEMIKTEKIDSETSKTMRPPPVEASSKALAKHSAVFSPDDIRDKMAPILRHLYDQEEGIWFRQPVTEAIAPGYFDVIKCPMDFSTIFKKMEEGQYATPFQFWEDMWLVFNNTWSFNKKTQRVYKSGLKIADMFMELIDPIMKDYGYCCGRQHVFLPPAMFCYGVNGMCCTIPRDGDYFVYSNPDSSRNNLSGDKYTFCKKCFDSVKSDCILVGDDPAQTLVEIPKVEFHQAKNDHQEQEAMVDCIVCARRFHNICVLYHDHIWPEGYVCKTCVNQYNIKRKENRYLAHKLTMTDLASTLEKRVNTFLRKECDADTGRVTIRVLAASDRVCEIKPRFKKHFASQVPDGYPYRTKAIFAFQEIEGVDVVLFGMHVQEYDSRCPGPNAKRVYVSYLDSVHYFRPKQKRTALYYEILIGYLDYVKQLGFVYAHIWACPPSEGDDYIFYCHPAEQRVPKPKRLQEWYKTMLDIAVQQRVVVDFKDIMKDCTDSGLNKATDLPYFEGDFWTSTLEDLIKELDIEEEDRRKFEELEAVKASDDGYFDDSIEPEEPTETSDKRKSGGGTTHKKKNFKKTASQRRIARKNMTNGSDLISKIYAMMEKHKESFFVVRLRNPMSNPPTLTDTDPLIQCDLMESRDAFLSLARDKHCEFSSVRRAKYSTMVSLVELHSATADKISYTCNACRQQCDVRYHCTVCEDYDLCTKCYQTLKHEHRMERSDEANDTTANSDNAVNLQQQRQITMQRMVETIRHAIQCRNANCIFKNCSPCKRLIQHTRECTKASRTQCPLCNKILSPIWFHAKTCTDQNCLLPYCASFKNKLQRQRAATMQADRRRVTAMHRAKMGPGPSPLNSQTSEPATTAAAAAQYHHSMDSSSPSSSGKMMPSGGKGSKGGKPTSMSGLVRSTLTQQMPLQSQQHPGYYPGGKGNPTVGGNAGYPMMMTHPQQPTQQWMPSQPPQQAPPPPQTQQQIRYPTHGGKPMAYGQQRMPYGNDPYMMRQQPTQVPAGSPAPYPYPSNIAPPAYGHSQPMDPNSMNMIRGGKPMLSQQPTQSVPARYPLNSYYGQPNSMSYPQQPPMAPGPPHRLLSQNPPPNYSVPSTPMPGNGATTKSNLMESIELKSDDPFDDPSKLQPVPQQHQMFQPLLQTRARPQSTPYYPNMPPTNNAYYSVQRPVTPAPDYNMSVGRGMRLPSAPANTYGQLPAQARGYMPSSANDLTASMNNNIPMGHQSTPPPPPPPSVTPH